MTHLVRLETLSTAERFNDEVFGIIEPFLGRSVLEVGMGIGTFTERLLKRCERVVGVEIVPEFAEISRRKFEGRDDVEVHEADMGAGIPPFLEGRRFDTIVCMNVLEHIENDVRTLEDFFTLLEPGGRAVLIVPQYSWLFNPLDANDGHFRRYHRRGLREKLERTGFHVEHQSRFNMTGILGWFVNGAILRRRELPKNQMRMYDRLVPWLMRAERFIGPPLGLSLFMVGQRPAATAARREASTVR